MLVIVPSRGRPEKVIELIQAWESTRFGADLLICVDDDDPMLDGYKAINRPPWAMLVIGPRMRLGPTLNHWSVRMMTDYSYIGFMGDDHRPRTAGWDKSFRESIGDLGIAYGNDLLQGENLATAVMMSSNIVRALGRMVPPGMIHMYLDNYWRDLGEKLQRRIYLPHVVIEHLHPIAGKAEWDDGYREVNHGDVYAADAAAYEKFVHELNGLECDVNAIREYVGGARA